MKSSGLQKIMALLFVLGLVCFMTSCAGGLKNITKEIDGGWQELDVAGLEKKAAELEEMVKTNTTDPLAPYYAAKAHFAVADCLDIKSSEEFDKTGKGDEHLDKAIELIKASIELKEDSVDSQILKFNIIRRKMGHVGFPQLMMYVKDRHDSFTKAKELAPDSIDVQFLEAMQFSEAAHPAPPAEETSQKFGEILKRDPKMAEAYYQTGVAWEKESKIDSAKENYKKALEVDPNHHWAKKKLNGLAG
jgi:tetratricopeptide (TPR) repeat protein